MFKNIAKALGGDPQKKELDRAIVLVDQINQLESAYEALSADELRSKTDEFRQRLADGQTLDDLLVEAFAAVREASKRTTGLRHYDVQLIGGIFMHEGKIVEMRTGEGKTLVATLPLYLNALAGKGAHLVTVNDYLARRDARWMAPIYDYLGLSVGVLQMSGRKVSSQYAFIVDLEKHENRENIDQLQLVTRKEAYNADITYGTNNEFGFDYLRDNLTMNTDRRVQRGLSFAIIDEVDNILIDEARTPLIISGPASEDVEWYNRMAAIVKELKPDEDFDYVEKDRSVALTEIGEIHVEDLLQIPLRDPDNPEDITPEQARLLGYLEQALRAQVMFTKNKDYIVQKGKVIIVDEFTGRLMPGRRWSGGLHQAVEAKEGVKVNPENITHATITLQNFFRIYTKLSGMTGTAKSEAEEFSTIYDLDVIEMPTNLDFEASRPNSELQIMQGKDNEGYDYTYYVRADDDSKQAVFWKRKDYPDVVFRTEEAKLRAIVLEIIRFHVQGRPILVGTTSIEHSEKLAGRLKSEILKRLLMAILTREAWLKKSNNSNPEREYPEVAFLNKPLENLMPNEIRQFSQSAGLPSINPENADNIDFFLDYFDLSAADRERMENTIKNGIQNTVLNARKHDDESKIIEDAGALGAVTIATNMAGRGVDIKLGGQLQEYILADVRNFLYKNKVDYFEKSLSELVEEADKFPKSNFKPSEEIEALRQHVEKLNLVKKLGGLHVIGSERHEARRIDNQLRGRAARQGDPGSSRFYLSLEDDLMRMFGGERTENLMRVFNIDPSYPVESKMLGRLVEQAQDRVEGYNFDMRKHLLDYDNILNDQRERIYTERDRIFKKDNLEEDVLGMLRTELQRRIPEALEKINDPRKSDEENQGNEFESLSGLLGFLEKIQPTLFYPKYDVSLPSYSMSLIKAYLENNIEDLDDKAGIKDGLFKLAEAAIQAEGKHILIQLKTSIEKKADNFSQQLAERLDLLDIIVENNADLFQSSPKDFLNQIQKEIHLKIEPDAETIQALKDSPEQLSQTLRDIVQQSIMQNALSRLVTTIERKMDSSLPVDIHELANSDWLTIEDKLEEAISQQYEQKAASIKEPKNPINQNINAWVDKQAESSNGFNLLELAVQMRVGQRMGINPQTRKRVKLRIVLFRYTYLAAQSLVGKDADEITGAILAHLEGTQAKKVEIWGRIEMERIAENFQTIADLPEEYSENLETFITPEARTAMESNSFISLLEANDTEVIKCFGRSVQQTFYRHILLRSISDLWIEHLTNMEALRISIGMEAYAQQDPLVLYKSRSTDAFKNLFAGIRMGVVTRMFSMRPAVKKIDTGEPTPPPQQQQPAGENKSSNSNKKKRKRRKRR